MYEGKMIEDQHKCAAPHQVVEVNDQHVSHVIIGCEGVVGINVHEMAEGR